MELVRVSTVTWPRLDNNEFESVFTCDMVVVENGLVELDVGVTALIDLSRAAISLALA